MIKLSFLILCLVLLALPLECFAQRNNRQRKKSAPNNTATVKTSTPKFITRPFSVSNDFLPAKFLGHNAESIYLQILPIAMEAASGCGKYEKSTDCQHRLNAIRNKSIGSGLRASDRLAFSFGVECSYDADEEKAQCPIFSGWYYPWSRKLTQSYSYVGSNAFGVSKTIDFLRFENVNISSNRGAHGFTIDNLEPSLAQLVLPNMRLLVIGTLGEPMIKHDQDHKKPTFNSPTEIIENHSIISLDIEEVWLYNFENGKVYAKQQPK